MAWRDGVEGPGLWPATKMTAEPRPQEGSGASCRLSCPSLLLRPTLQGPGGEGEATAQGLAFELPSHRLHPGVQPLLGDLCFANYGTPRKKGLFMMGTLSSLT